MTVLSTGLVIGVGFCAGFLNVLAGGGSLLSIPLLVFMGLDVSVANATNRVGVLAQNLVATHQFYKKSLVTIEDSAFFGLPAMAGALVGTFSAISLDERYLSIAVAILITAMAIFLLVKPDMWERERQVPISKWIVAIFMFVVGIYGGFVQAGVGFFLLWVIVGAAGKDLLHANALKVAVIALFTALSLAIFLYHGLVDFYYGMLLAIGNFIGGAMAVRFAVLKGNRWLRWILTIVVTVSALRMLINVLR